MECNKEEAIRAKIIAEQRMGNGDHEGALRIALKAQRLFPELENISQILTVCQVHCSAKNNLSGSEMDWYGILQIEQFCDENTVRKQYRKLALLLHPDKNKFAGAEAAFKLIGEANRVLTDQTKRSQYDMKCRAQMKVPTKPPFNDQSKRAAPKPPSNQSKRAAAKPPTNQSSRTPHRKNQNGFPNVSSPFMASNIHQQVKPSFWTYCTACGFRYQYLKAYMDKLLRCQNCKASFIARDLGPQVLLPGFSLNQFSYKKEVPCRFAGSDPMPKKKNASEVCQASTTEKKVGHSYAGSERNGVEKSQSNAAKPPDNQSSRTFHVKNLYCFPNVSSPFVASNTQQQTQQPSFWTYCTACGFMFEYPKAYVDELLKCQNCKASFIAHDLGLQGVSPGFSWIQFPNEKEVPHRFSGSDPMHKETNASEVCLGSKTKMKGAGGNGVEESTSNAARPGQSGTRRNVNRKRGRELSEQSSESLETSSAGNNDDVDIEKTSVNYD
ncbi:hypothetical protein SLE2022_054920 [Rubroshorea leprosula]